MKNIFLTICVLIFTISCKAQVIGTLEQFEECSKRPNRGIDGCPDLDNITYVKDTNNRLDQFVGTWKGTYGGKSYEIKFTKELKYGDDDIKWDRVFGKVLIKDSKGNILHNTLNSQLSDTGLLRGGNFQSRVYVMGFVANAECNDSGDVFVEVRKNNPNEISLYFDRDKTWYDARKCPNFDTYVPLLPQDKMTLTKQ